MAFHFKDQQVLRAGTVFAAESRLRNKHFSSSSPVESQETPLPLLIHFKTAELHAPDIFSLHTYMHHTYSLQSIIVCCDEVSQKMKLSNIPTCCHLLFVCAVLFILQRVTSVALSFILQKTQIHVLKIIQPLFRGPCPILEHCYSPAEHFQVFTFCRLSQQDFQLPVLFR